MAGLISFLQCGHSNFIEKFCLDAFFAGDYLFEGSDLKCRGILVEQVPTGGPVSVVLSKEMDSLTHMCRL